MTPKSHAPQATSRPNGERAIATFIAYKRIVTGTASIVASIALGLFAGTHGGNSLMSALAIAIFALGGVWMLRDGVRGRRALLDEKT